jgi:hypothetical protein
MFARVSVVQSRPERVDASTKTYRESVVPAAKSQKGKVDPKNRTIW